MRHLTRQTPRPRLTRPPKFLALLLAAALAPVVLAPVLAAPVLAAPAALAAASGATRLEALLEHLARPAPSSTAFVEARFSPILTRPLVVSGKLEYLGPRELSRTVERPYHERADIRGDTVTVTREGQPPQRFSLERVPAMRSLLASFTALLSGNVRALKRQFQLDLHGDSQLWTVGLTPRDPQVHARIRSITVTGRGKDPRCLTTFQANGDVTVLLIGRAARAQLPAAPARAWLEDRCRGSTGAR
ncbi:MAG: LolA-related protein [Steroidobacteraceae bacterium]